MPFVTKSAPKPAPEDGETAGGNDGAKATSRPRLGAFLLGLALIPLLVFWVEYTEIVANGPDMAAMSLPMAAIFALLILIPLNMLVRRWKPGAALTQAELLLVYSMNVVAVYISGIGMMQFLHPPLVGWRHYATPANGWASWSRWVKLWAVPDAGVVPDYYSGKSSFFTPAHMAGWAGTITVWTVFLFVLLFCMYCVAVLVRRQWVDNERLLFPLVQLPLEMTRNGGDAPLWRRPLFWGGAALAAVLETMATLHYTMIPTLPYFPIKAGEPGYDLGQYITVPPWNTVGFTALAFYPLVIGLGFLLSIDISFSCWFFYLLTKVENVLATAFGLHDAGAGAALSRVPYIGDQAVGAFVGLALLSLWLARTQLRASWRRAFFKDMTVDDADEPMSYKTAYIGLFMSFLLLVGFGAALGLSPLISALFFGLFLLLVLTMTRIRAEAGLPWGQGPPDMAHGAITGYLGTQNLTGQDMTALSFLHWFDSDWRCLVQPAELEAMKMASSTQPHPLNPRLMTGALLAAVLVGALASWVSSLGIYYHYGADSAHVNDWRSAQGHYAFDQLQGWLRNPLPSDGPRLGGAAVGLTVVCLLSALRLRFVWWPLNPIGYAVANTDTLTWIWFPVLLAWLCKVLILRYGGIKVYRTALPFFLGLALGDYGISGLWSLWFLLTGHPGYRTFPI